MTQLRLATLKMDKAAPRVQAARSKEEQVREVLQVQAGRSKEEQVREVLRVQAARSKAGRARLDLAASECSQLYTPCRSLAVIDSSATGH